MARLNHSSKFGVGYSSPHRMKLQFMLFNWFQTFTCFAPSKIRSAFLLSLLDGLTNIGRFTSSFLLSPGTSLQDENDRSGQGENHFLTSEVTITRKLPFKRFKPFQPFHLSSRHICLAPVPVVPLVQSLPCDFRIAALKQALRSRRKRSLTITRKTPARFAVISKHWKR
jgi:hypothetical protein